MARMMDDAGIDFMLPIGRWKGYGGDTDYQGSTYETITWATGLLAQTKRITVFGTVHAPLFHPLIAAKQMVTADHVGAAASASTSCAVGTKASSTCSACAGRITTARYRQGQEWLEVMRRALDRGRLRLRRRVLSTSRASARSPSRTAERSRSR